MESVLYVVVICSTPVVLQLEIVSSQLNCQSLGGSYNCTIPTSYLNDSWCDCLTCMCVDESSWTCSTCSPSGCTDDPECCTTTQCQLWGSTTDLPQSTQSAFSSSSSSTASNSMTTTAHSDTDYNINITSASNAPGPPQDLCIKSNIFKHGWTTSGLTQMLFVLTYASTQEDNGPVVKHYNWDDQLMG